ncbi:hypothetical protein FSARC_8388 [Fusarium sarcochroum]|uniref:2EXR domain-containing protein n=1 Tax=Fusarium sarcochroum TaxID=1208366 RepID=A0A8H4X6E0_9HYPO|nr:hypothetical protein FSARC_8388 [Fusarium sarcochroum]
MAPTDETPSTSRHLQLFNPIPERYHAFHLFPRFTEDIRWLVWEKVLSHERMIDITLRPADCANETKHPRDYDIVVDNRWKLSKLFRTTSESRRAALAFYRVQLPCWYQSQRNQGEMNGVLYLCPELDTLMLNSLEVFEYFAHDLWAHDPRRVGLINLALEVKHPINAYKTPDTEGRDTTLLKEALLRIKRLTIMSTSCTRKHWIDLDGSRNIKDFQRNRTPPIRGGVLGFERLSCDARLNKDSLKAVYLGSWDPRELFYRWFRFLALLGVQHNHKIDYRVGICRKGFEIRPVSDRNRAVEWLQDEHRKLKGQLQFLRGPPTYADQFDDEIAKLLGPFPPPVVGFWLFSMESLGPLPDINEIHGPESTVFRRKKTLDMSKHKPELCLANIY